MKEQITPITVKQAELMWYTINQNSMLVTIDNWKQKGYIRKSAEEEWKEWALINQDYSIRVDCSEGIILAVKAIDELKTRIKELEARIKELEGK
jgi:hypothetical protein